MRFQAPRDKKQAKGLMKNELYQLKVDVGMLNTVKNYWADVSSVSPSSKQNKKQTKRKKERKETTLYSARWTTGTGLLEETWRPCLSPMVTLLLFCSMTKGWCRLTGTSIPLFHERCLTDRLAHCLLTFYDPHSTDRVWPTLYWPSMIHTLLTFYDPHSTDRLWPTVYWLSMIHTLLLSVKILRLSYECIDPGYTSHLDIPLSFATFAVNWCFTPSSRSRGTFYSFWQM